MKSFSVGVGHDKNSRKAKLERANLSQLISRATTPCMAFFVYRIRAALLGL